MRLNCKQKIFRLFSSFTSSAHCELGTQLSLHDLLGGHVERGQRGIKGIFRTTSRKQDKNRVLF